MKMTKQHVRWSTLAGVILSLHLHTDALGDTSSLRTRVYQMWEWAKDQKYIPHDAPHPKVTFDANMEGGGWYRTDKHEITLNPKILTEGDPFALPHEVFHAISMEAFPNWADSVDDVDMEGYAVMMAYTYYRERLHGMVTFNTFLDRKYPINSRKGKAYRGWVTEFLKRHNLNPSMSMHSIHRAILTKQNRLALESRVGATASRNARRQKWGMQGSRVDFDAAERNALDILRRSGVSEADINKHWRSSGAREQWRRTIERELAK